MLGHTLGIIASSVVTDSGPAPDYELFLSLQALNIVTRREGISEAAINVITRREGISEAAINVITRREGISEAAINVIYSPGQ
jgi:hypothetical protein